MAWGSYQVTSYRSCRGFSYSGYKVSFTYHGCGSPVGLSAGVGAVALLGSIHRGRSVQGLNRYRCRLAPGLGGSKAEGPNPPVIYRSIHQFEIDLPSKVEKIILRKHNSVQHHTSCLCILNSILRGGFEKFEERRRWRETNRKQ
ncbi:hypothetical protein YC2023_013296 [Brassica napus]